MTTEMMAMLSGGDRRVRRVSTAAMVALLALVAVPACQPYHIAKSELERMAAEAEAKMMAELELERREEAERAVEAARVAETQRIAAAQQAERAAETQRIAAAQQAERAAEAQRIAAAQQAAEQRAANERAAEQRRRQEQAGAANGGSASAGADGSTSARVGASASGARPGGGVQDGGSVRTGTTGGTWSNARFVQGDKPVQYQVQMLGTNPDGSAKALFRFFVNEQDDINNCGPIADCLGYYLELKYNWNDPAMEYDNIEFYWFDKNSDSMLTIGPVNVPMGGDDRARSAYDPQEGFQVRYANGAVEHRMPFSACADHRLASYNGHRCLRFEDQIPAVLVR